MRFFLFISLIFSLFITHSALAYQDTFLIKNSYSSDNYQLPSSLGFFPDDHVLFDKNTKILAISGKDNGSFNEKLYLWRYINETQEVEFISSAGFNIPAESAQFSSIRLVGFQNNSIFAVRYIKKSDYDEAVSSLLRFELVQGILTLVQEKTLKLNNKNNWLMQTFLINESTLVSFHSASHGVFYSVCSIGDLQNIGDCTTHQLLSDHPTVLTMNEYKIHPLNTIDKYLFSPRSPTGHAEDPITESILLEFNQELKQFKYTQSLPIPVDSSIEYTLVHLGVDSAFVTGDGNNMHIGYYNLGSYHYKYNEDNSLWEKSDSFSSDFPSGFTQSEDHFFISNGSNSVLLLDDKDNQFYKIRFTNNIQSPNIVFTEANKGISVSSSSILNTVTLTTFEFDNTPTFYKGGISQENIVIAQDEIISINYGKYFINAPGMTLTGLSNNLNWDGEFLTGVFTNNDLFTTDDENNPEMLEVINLNFRLPEPDGSGTTSVAFQSIELVNINDAPILVEILATESLTIGESYTGDLKQIVKDPDREEIVFTFENVPNGFSTNTLGIISGSINTAGSYTINVTANDNNGGKLSFELTLVVSDKTVKITESSSGGGGSGGTVFILLILAAYYRVLGRKSVMQILKNTM
jgi:hypothetical protein